MASKIIWEQPFTFSYVNKFKNIKMCLKHMIGKNLCIFYCSNLFHCMVCVRFDFSCVGVFVFHCFFLFTFCCTIFQGPFEKKMSRRKTGHQYEFLPWVPQTLVKPLTFIDHILQHPIIISATVCHVKISSCFNLTLSYSLSCV